MTLTRELHGSEVRLLRAAANHKIYSPIYDDSRAMAKRLAGEGLLKPMGPEMYQITPEGLELVPPTPDTEEPPQPVRQTRRMQKPAQRPHPQSVKLTLHPVTFRKLRTRQQAILRFVDGHIKQMGFPPTYREIGAKVGIPTTSVVAYNIDRLIVAGWMDRTEGVPRSLCLVQELPGGKTKNEIQVSRGVLKIAVHLTGNPDDILETAREAMERLQGVIDTVTGGGQ